jgi:hypothetical protein
MNASALAIPAALSTAGSLKVAAKLVGRAADRLRYCIARSSAADVRVVGWRVEAAV